MKIIRVPKVCLLPRPFQNLSNAFFFVNRDSNFFSIGGRPQLCEIKLERIDCGLGSIATLGEEEILKLATLGNEFNGARILLINLDGEVEDETAPVPLSSVEDNIAQGCAGSSDENKCFFQRYMC
ncbi:hypothetical protein V2J09_006263 [Rumex salicifolius]